MFVFFTHFSLIASTFQVVASSLRNVVFHRPVSSNWGSQTRSNSSGNNANDQQIRVVLEKSFPEASEIIVNDISGGCGAMFEVSVISSSFNGMAKVKQHLAVSQVC